MQTSPSGKRGTIKNIHYLHASQTPNGSWLSNRGSSYATSLALLSIALNYRFLPIYEQ